MDTPDIQMPRYSLNPALDTLIRCAGNVARHLRHENLPSGGHHTLPNVMLHQLRDAFANYERSIGIQSRLDAASRSVSDDKPIAAPAGIRGGNALAGYETMNEVVA